MLSEPRMAPYLRITGNNQHDALSLYEWSTRTSAAAFEVIGHLEVLFRNALDRQLREHFREDKCGIPWFLLPTPGGDHVSAAVATVRERLRPLGKEVPFEIRQTRRDDVEWTKEEADRLRASADRSIARSPRSSTRLAVRTGPTGFIKSFSSPGPAIQHTDN